MEDRLGLKEWSDTFTMRCLSQIKLLFERNRFFFWASSTSLFLGISLTSAGLICKSVDSSLRVQEKMIEAKLDAQSKEMQLQSKEMQLQSKEMHRQLKEMKSDILREVRHS